MVFSQNAPAPRKFIEFVFTPNAKDWTYSVGQNAAVDVSVLKFGVPLEDVTINYEIGPEMLAPDRKEILVLKNG
jgi:hypothetical protein